MKYWDVRHEPLRTAIINADYTFDLIEENGKVNLTAMHWVEVEIGVICQDVISWFTSGNCALLALMLHEHYGYQLALLTNPDPKDADEKDWAHAFVIHPNGKALDITGLCTVEDMVSRWSRQWGEQWSTVITVTRDEMVQRTGDYKEEDFYSEIELAVAQDFARILHESHR